EKYSITELSGILQLTDHALRYYEKEFGLNVPKNGRGRRFYTTDLANIMYQIKTMRSEGLEIKAIRNILQSEDIIKEPPPVVSDEISRDIVSIGSQYGGIKDIQAFFNEFKEQLASELSNEILITKDHLSKEISKSKLELGACVENGMRRLEAKMERHFLDVDRSLGMWREKNKKGVFKKLLSRTLK
ncbi:MAG: MerR family transcriptional regulator, partial [Clostridiales bacterium GWC2_40_7]